MPERGSVVYVTRIYARSQRDDHRTFAAFSRNRASTAEHLRHIEIISLRVVPGILEPARYRLGNDFRRLRGVHRNYRIGTDGEEVSKHVSFFFLLRSTNTDSAKYKFSSRSPPAI